MPSKRIPYPHPEQADVWCVPLTRGYVALIDASDVPLVLGHSWHAHIYPTGYVYAKAHIQGKHVALHRLLMGDGPPIVDHISRDTLDCRRSNLRGVTRGENRMNSRKDRDNASGYKGVYEHRGAKRAKPFEAQIVIDGKRKHIGYYASKHEAADAYRNAVVKARGETYVH
jgi:hypothetical protein